MNWISFVSEISIPQAAGFDKHVLPEHDSSERVVDVLTKAVGAIWEAAPQCSVLV
jgi:hypothetical protein